MTMDPLPHLNDSGDARMVDVGAKQVTQRSATAAGMLRTSSDVVELLRGEGVPKGDALAVARIAAINGTKRTADLIPLCHPLRLDGVDVALDVVDEGVAITVTCRATDRTGVEMEALTGVAVAGLALHDMVKAVDPAAVLTEVRLLTKTGGRSGDWSRA
jgi:cyclic pyranopterin phosphate synthase